MSYLVTLRRTTEEEVVIEVSEEDAENQEHAIRIAKERSNEEDTRWAYYDSWISKVLEVRGGKT